MRAPTDAGPVNGCPEADTDGDGIVDSQDACPEDANHDSVGDPCNHDEDDDLVDDFNDLCPLESANTPDGCPAPAGSEEGSEGEGEGSA